MMNLVKKESFIEPHKPRPDPCLDEKEVPWAILNSLSSLKLSLHHILRNCLIPRTPPLVEFPLKTETEPTDSEPSFQLRTQPSIARLQRDQLPLKIAQLRSTVELYNERLDYLQQGSRAIFGEIRGHKMCLMVDTSTSHACIEKAENQSESDEEDDEGEKEEERPEFSECKRNLQQLFKEQLSKKNKVYLLQLGSDDSDKSSPIPLNFKKYRERSLKVAGQWVESLKGSGQMCSILTGLEKGLSLNSIDTLVIVMGSKPKEEKEEVVKCLRNTADSPIQIHWIAHRCDSDTKDMLGRLAAETGAHYHSYSHSVEDTEKVEIEDTEVDSIKAELKQALDVISDLEVLVASGTISTNVLHTLMQLNMTCCEFEVKDEIAHCNTYLSVTSKQWLTSNSLKVLRLCIYDILAPNAYRQVKTRLCPTPDASTIIPSIVYDEALPQIKWHDGSLKYLHVDVHQLENYKMKVERYIHELRERLHWLSSGSRAPFGIISEDKVQLVVEFSAISLPFVCHLQNSLCLLLREQLQSHAQHFNITRIGDGCSAWKLGFSEKTPQSVSDAWVWLLSQTASGPPPRLLPALEMAFSVDPQDDHVGVYLILSSLPAESIGTICSFLKEKTAKHHNVNVNVVFYQWSPSSESHAMAGIRFEEGYYANEQELTQSLRQIATAGKGRFHKFKGPDEVCSDDIDDLVKELQKAQDHWRLAVKILNDYQTFCKQFVPVSTSAPPRPPPSEPPPLHPRPTTSFFCRLNAASRRMPRSVSDSQLSHHRHHRRTHRSEPGSTRRTKTYGFYLDTKRDKGFALERKFATIESLNHKPNSQSSRELRSISEWLLKNSIESLRLNFSQFEVGGLRAKTTKKKTYKHIKKQGEVVELYADHNGLKKYAEQVKKANEKYRQKLTELGTGWKNVLGWMSECKVLVLVDVSSSMAREFGELKTALLDLLQHKPISLKYLNLMAYSSSVKKWRDNLSPVSSPVGEEDEDSEEENISSAVQWVTELRPEGGSCLLHAMKISLESRYTTIYLITDGKSDHTHEFLLSQLSQLRSYYRHCWRINTIAFHCLSELSFVFLKELAHRTGGRYHCYPWGGSADDPTHHLLENKHLGDDIHRLMQEISTAEDQLNNALFYL